jgi:hypothetical protein
MGISLDTDCFSGGCRGFDSQLVDGAARTVVVGAGGDPLRYSVFLLVEEARGSCSFGLRDERKQWVTRILGGIGQ